MSPAADGSIGYRRAVREALRVPAEQQSKNGAGGLKAVDAIRARPGELHGAPEVHRQIAAYEILENIDEAIKNGSKEGSD